jgi:thioredoxin reductase
MNEVTIVGAGPAGLAAAEAALEAGADVTVSIAGSCPSHITSDVPTGPTTIGGVLAHAATSSSTTRTAGGSPIPLSSSSRAHQTHGPGCTSSQVMSTDTAGPAHSSSQRH